MRLYFLEIIRKLKRILLYWDNMYEKKEHNVIKRKCDLEQKNVQINTNKENSGHASLIEPPNRLSDNRVDSVVSLSSVNGKQEPTELIDLNDEEGENPKAELTGKVGFKEKNNQILKLEESKEVSEILKNDDNCLKTKESTQIQEIKIVIEEDAEKEVIEENIEDNLYNSSEENHFYRNLTDSSDNVKSFDTKPEIFNDNDKEIKMIGNRNEKSVKDMGSTDRAVSTYSRSELEQMYQDEIKLIVRPLDPVNLKLLRPVEDKNEYTHLYNRIMQEFLNVKLLCEIEINDKEYRVLCDYFRKKYVYITRDIGHAITDVLFCVALVQIGIRNYDGNFWNKISKVLGKEDKNIPNNQRTWIGGTFTQTMLGFGKPLYKENEYVTNIMMHCFVADIFAARFFEYLFQYYNLDLERDISSGVEEESIYICNSIKNPYGKRKQFLSNYLYLAVRGNQEYVRSVISSILKLIDQNFWDEYVEDITGSRILELFKKWQLETEHFQNEKKLHNTAHRVKNKNFRIPYIKCDMENVMFYIVLPSQLIPENRENSEVKWKISNSQELYVACELQEGYLREKTKEVQLPIDKKDIFAPFHFTLLADGQEIRTFTWNRKIINFFNECGDWIKGENLSEGMAYAYTEVGCQISSEGLLSESVRSGLKFYEFNLVVGDLINVDDKEYYYVGEIHKAGLLNEYKIEGLYLASTGEKIAVYSRLPLFVVDVEDEKFNGTAVWINGKITRLSEKSFVKINTGRRLEQKFYYLNLNLIQGICTGINRIVVDFPASTRQIRSEFGYIPDFDYIFEDAPYVYMDRGTLSLNRKIIKNKIIADVIDETQKYDFSFEMLERNQLVIPLEFQEGTVNAVFDVPIFIYSWDKKKWYAHKGEDIWYSELKEKLYIDYPASQITLGIRGVEHGKTAIIFNKNAEGIFECDLTKLKTYFDKSKMIQIVTMVYQGYELDIIRIIMRSFLQSAMLEADYEKECVRGTFEVIGKGQYYLDVFCDSDLLVEKKYIDSTTFEMKIPIRSAKYQVKVYEMEGDEFSFDEEYSLIGENVAELVNPIDLINTCIELNYFFATETPEKHLELKYNYMAFIEQKINSHRYWGVLVETFHHKNVTNASCIMIDIPNLNRMTSIALSFIDRKDGEEFGFLYDNYIKRIVEYESPRYSKSESYRRYEPLHNDAYLCNVKFIEKESHLQIKDKGYEWIKNHQITKEKHGIWKEDSTLSEEF